VYYVFKQTKIWDGYREIDETRPSRTVKGKTEEKARQKLPCDTGREWILVETKNNVRS
jgi:hypothetical protein